MERTADWAPSCRIAFKSARLAATAGWEPEYLMTSRYSFGGDEHLFVECDEAMSFAGFFRSLAATRAIRARALPGVTEICPGNTSYQIRFDPDLIHPDEILREVQTADRAAATSEPVIETRIIEIPVYYDDPWTRETLMRFRERHQDPTGSDLDYVARINGFPSAVEFIAAHHGSPWFVTMVGFVCGAPWFYQMVDREQQLQAPKYIRPRTDTPRHTIAHAGCFSCIYPVRGAGGYQMFGITPLQIFDPDQKLDYLPTELVLFRPGDIVKFNPIEREEYENTVAAVAQNRYTPRIRPVHFDLREFERDRDGYNAALIEALYRD